jgi:hypothetical protein
MRATGTESRVSRGFGVRALRLQRMARLRALF